MIGKIFDRHHTVSNVFPAGGSIRNATDHVVAVYISKNRLQDSSEHNNYYVLPGGKFPDDLVGHAVMMKARSRKPNYSTIVKLVWGELEVFAFAMCDESACEVMSNLIAQWIQEGRGV